MADAANLPSTTARTGRLARRLFALFVLLALPPLVFSDWIASLATTAVAERLTVAHQQATTHHTSRQVLERLLAGKAILTSEVESSGSDAQPLGLGRLFSHVVRIDAAGAQSWPAYRADELLTSWQQARGRGRPISPPGGSVVTELRVDYAERGQPRIMLGVFRAGRLSRIGVMDPAYLWAPLADAGLNSAWWVRDAADRLIVYQAGEDYTLRRDDSESTSAAGDVETHADLFLAGELMGGDWRFTQRVPREPVLWNGASLPMWLAGVAVATLLAIAALSHWRIRKTLEPLAELTQVTRRLAVDANGARVEIRRDDEIGELAEAFNDMALRIETQFDALAGLAAIDRDILAGAPFEQVAEHALQRVAARYPASCAMVAWRKGLTELRYAWLAPSGDGARLVMMDRIEPGEEALQSFAAIAADEMHDAAEASPVLCEALASCLRSSGVSRTPFAATLPLRHDGQTRAVLSLGSRTRLDDEAMQPVREIRDRLSVALSARMRDHELEHRASHDSLTGLVNRYGLQLQLDAMLQGLGEHGRLALISIDLDHFKDVNDTQGHAAGDVLLCAASHRLRSCMPAGATVARPGGDEFLVLLPGADETVAATVATLVLTALARPFILESGEHRHGASAGIALAPAHGRVRQELLRCADIALYAAKDAGRGGYAFFNADLDHEARDRVLLQTELRRAIARNEFRVHFQPRVQPGDGRIVSAEALVRWQHPERGLLHPGTFIEAAETAGLIDEIGQWVLDAACAQVAAWRSAGVALQRISVNLSPRQLARGDLPEVVAAVLEKHRLPGTALELEVTESLLMNDPGSARAQLAVLRQRGVRIALDDFGTGYSSMSLLRQLPIDVMKIDRSFVIGLGVDDGAMAVTRAIVTLARSLRMHLVAEGVETDEQATVLRELGCDELQGYLYSRPVAAADFERLAALPRAVNAGRLSLVSGRST